MRLVLLALLLAGCSDPAGEVVDAAGGDAAGDDDDDDDGGAPPIGAACGMLEVGGGVVIDVGPAQADELGAIVAGAAAGTMIRLADGVYPVSGDVVMNFDQPGVTLVSASRDAAAVVIDGGDGYAAREIVQVTASDVTIAHVTIRHAQDHLVHLYPSGETDVTGVLLYGLVLEDAGQHFVKSNADEPNTNYAEASFVDEVTVACSTFTLTAAGRAYVPTNPHNVDFGYPCYTGGIDAHAARGWVVARNAFDGIYCEGGASLAEHAIHFWNSGRDQLIERNVVRDCARGIGLGLYWGEPLPERPYPDDPHAGDKVDDTVGNYDGVIRNNVVYARMSEHDAGITLDQAIGARVHHNTVILSQEAGGNPIEYRWPNSIVELRNNIATAIVVRDGASGVVEPNRLDPGAGEFVDAAGGDFHLAAGATLSIDQGVLVDGAGLDLDGEAHDDGAPDLGADER